MLSGEAVQRPTGRFDQIGSVVSNERAVRALRQNGLSGQLSAVILTTELETRRIGARLSIGTFTLPHLTGNTSQTSTISPLLAHHMSQVCANDYAKYVDLRCRIQIARLTWQRRATESFVINNIGMVTAS